MIKIEAQTLEDAYKDAASTFSCSVTELKIEVVQYPSKGLLGLFKKSAVIVATKDIKEVVTKEIVEEVQKPSKKEKEPKTESNVVNETIMPTSFVSVQDEHEEYSTQNEEEDVADIDEEIENAINVDMHQIAATVKEEINNLFHSICFDIEEIEVSAYDDSTLLVEFKGEDAALLIGKEGYRYKALSYMIFNWINSKYQVQLRLEIAEFLKNQEEAVSRYLTSVAENVERDGRAQTKILDGVLVQIALKELREMYPDKYVVIRSTRDGLKYIIINDYHSN